MKLILVLTAVIVGQAWANSNLCKLNLYSPNGNIMYSYFPFINNRVEFIIRSTGGVRILLSNDYAPNVSRNYEMVIGSDGLYNVRLFRNGNLLASKDLHILVQHDFRRFVLTASKGEITLITNTDYLVLSHKDPIFVPMHIVGIAANSNMEAEIHYDCEQFVRKN